MTTPKQTYKALLLDYDALLLATDKECCFSLSEREVQILLAFVDYACWPTRYFATDNVIDRETIAQWGGNLARKLMSGCCPDDGVLHRFNDDGVWESSIDGGVTWTPDPDGDPRRDYILAPQLPGSASDEKRCAAADNIRSVFKQYRDELAQILAAGSTVVAIIAGILAFIGAIAGVSGVAIGISVLLISLAAELLTLTPSAVVAAISETVLDDFKCLVYCQLDNDGQLSEANWNDLKVNIAANYTGFPETFFYNTVNALGYIGMSNAGTMGPATATDCGDCECVAECGDPELVTIGTVIAQGVDAFGRRYLHIQSEAFSTYQNVSIGTYGEPSPPNTCCHIYGTGIISGAINSSGYTNCAGTVVDPGNPETHDCGHATWSTAPGDNTPFVISVTFGA